MLMSIEERRQRRRERRAERARARSVLLKTASEVYSVDDTPEEFRQKMEERLEDDWQSERPFLALLYNLLDELLPRLIAFLFSLLQPAQGGLVGRVV